MYNLSATATLSWYNKLDTKITAKEIAEFNKPKDRVYFTLGDMNSKLPLKERSKHFEVSKIF